MAAVALTVALALAALWRLLPLIVVIALVAGGAVPLRAAAVTCARAATSSRTPIW